MGVVGTAAKPEESPEKRRSAIQRSTSPTLTFPFMDRFRVKMDIVIYAARMYSFRTILLG